MQPIYLLIDYKWVSRNNLLKDSLRTREIHFCILKMVLRDDSLRYVCYVIGAFNFVQSPKTDNNGGIRPTMEKAVY